MFYSSYIRDEIELSICFIAIDERKLVAIDERKLVAL